MFWIGVFRQVRHIFTAAILVAMLAPALAHGCQQPAQATRSDTQAKLLFAGDLMLGRYVGASMAEHGYDAPFAGARSFLSAADVAVGNLEGPLVPSSAFTIPVATPNQPLLTGDSRAAPALARAGIDILSLANNHSLDAGPAGLRATVSALRSAGIASTGVATGGIQVPVVRQVRGLRIAFLAYTAIAPNIGGPGPSAGEAWPDVIRSEGVGQLANQQDLARMQKAVAAAKQQVDVVVVLMHWGTEYSTQPDDSQRKIASAATSAGADLVVGSHPHVGQGLEVYGEPPRPALVAYSLGNGLFDQASDSSTRQGLALEATVDRQGLASAHMIPIETTSGANGFAMQVDDNASGQPVLQRAALSTPQDLQWKVEWDVAQPSPGVAIAYHRAETQAERSSIEDLGIGVTTRVQLHSGALTVSTLSGTQSHTVWASDPGWRVTGYAVGDADADGKPELIYTLWKHRLTSERPEGGGLIVNQEGGDILPHIYINGWRNGAMRPVWHGSPRPAPILSVAVATVGKDGRPLLAVLESHDSSVETAPGPLRVWEWTGGFGFELGSDLPGAYSQLWTDGKVLLFK